MSRIRTQMAKLGAALTNGWPTEPEKPEGLPWWRERIVEAILLLAVVCGLVAYVPGLCLALKEGLWTVAVVDTAAYLALIWMWRTRLIGWRTKAWLVLAACFLLGVTLLVTVGFFGAGYLWLMAVSVFAGVIWGLRAAALCFALNAASMAVLGYLLGVGVLDWTPALGNAVAKWTVIAANFLFISLVLSLSLSVLFKGLQSSLRHSVESSRDMERTNQTLRQEIAARERTSADLLASEERYRELIESISDCIMTHDLDGVVLSINSIAANSLGYLAEQVVGHNIAEFLTPAYEERFQRDYLPQLKRIGHGMGMMELVARDGQTHFFEYRTSVVQPLEGRPYVSGLARDVTSRVEADRQVRRLQDQLAQARKMEALGTLSGGIAHDFNNILAAIMGYAEICQLQINEGKGQDNGQHLERIVKAAERARDLISQILTYSRPKGKDMKLIRLGPLVREVADLFRGGLPANMSIKTNLEAGQEMLLCDPTQIQQLLMNLCANAMHAMERYGGMIRIGLQAVDLAAGEVGDLPAGGYLRLTVADDGDGIPAAIADRVFDPFFTTKAEGKGTGMGLAVAHGIVKAHHGAITFASAPGAGTTFQIHLPRSAESSPAEATGKRHADQPLPGGSERVLVVDDEAPLVDITANSLGRLGYQVRGETDPLLALELFKDDPGAFDVVVTDQSMPRLTGLQLIAALRSLRPELPVVLCTGNLASIPTEGQNGPAKPDVLLQKPLDRRSLALALRQALDKA